MAGYRQIHTKIWKDEWFSELEPDEKMLFIYLFSNELASIAGIYKIPLKIMVFETGLDKGFILETLAKFEQANKVFYENGVVWVANMSRYHANASDTTKKKVMKDLEMIEDCPIKQKYMKVVWGIDTTINIKTGYQYQSLKDKDKDKDKDKTKAETKSGAGAVFTLYENNIGTISSIVSEKIKEAVEEFPPDWIESAIQVAVENNVRKWSYIRAILDRWQVEGFKSNGKKPKAEEEVDMKGYTDATIYK
jgi:DnaD/phage-associated family protein